MRVQAVFCGQALEVFNGKVCCVAVNGSGRARSALDRNLTLLIAIAHEEGEDNARPEAEQTEEDDGDPSFEVVQVLALHGIQHAQSTCHHAL